MPVPLSRPQRSCWVRAAPTTSLQTPDRLSPPRRHPNQAGSDGVTDTTLTTEPSPIDTEPTGTLPTKDLSAEIRAVIDASMRPGALQWDCCTADGRPTGVSVAVRARQRRHPAGSWNQRRRHTVLDEQVSSISGPTVSPSSGRWGISSSTTACSTQQQPSTHGYRPCRTPIASRSRCSRRHNHAPNSFSDGATGAIVDLFATIDGPRWSTPWQTFPRSPSGNLRGRKPPPSEHGRSGHGDRRRDRQAAGRSAQRAVLVARRFGQHIAQRRHRSARQLPARRVRPEQRQARHIHGARHRLLHVPRR